MKMLVLTDFSDNALHAAQFACNLSKVTETKEIILFHNFDVSALLAPNEMSSLLAPVEATGIFNNYEWASEQIEVIKKENSEELETLRSRLLPLVAEGTSIKCRADTTQLPEAVNQLCEQENIQLVIMGIKGRTGMEKVLIGSNAVTAIEHVKFPLIIVPFEAPVKAPERLLISADLKNIQPQALSQLDQVLSAIGGKLLALNVMGGDMETETIKKDLVPFQQLLIKHSAEFFFTSGEDISESINKFAGDHKVSMIISLHRIKGFFDGLFHKSLTKKLAWHTKIPLLVINTK